MFLVLPSTLLAVFVLIITILLAYACRPGTNP
jgi:hypothetical protein